MTPETVIYAMWSLWLVSWLAAAVWSGRVVKRAAIRHEIGYQLVIGVGIVLLFGAYRQDHQAETSLWHPPIMLAWGFAALVLVGLLFTWWARVHLGRLWSSSVTRKADHHLVDTGPYGIVRHPIYTGIILASLATAAMRGTGSAWLGAAVMTAGWVLKARLEEVFLRQQLGAETYGEYARRVPMLAPLPVRRHAARD